MMLNMLPGGIAAIFWVVCSVLVLFVCLRQGSPGWPQTHSDLPASAPALPSSGITGLYHHAWLEDIYCHKGVDATGL